MEAVIMGIVLIAINNWVMQGIKKVAGMKAGVVWLRGVLVVLSLAGVVITAGLEGKPIDVNQVSDLLMAAGEIIALAVGSHVSYKVISA